MSEFKASGFRDEFGSGGPDLVGITTMTSPYYFVPPSGSTAERPQDPPPGMLRFNTDIGRLEVWRNDHWATITGEPSSPLGGRGVSAGGKVSPAWVNTMEYITIATTGDSIDFGDLTVARGNGFGGCGSATRGLFGGGGIGSPGSATFYNVIDFITISTLGNATDFGDRTVTRQEMNGLSDATRGVWGGGEPATNIIDFVTIASTGNASDFGDLFSGRYGVDSLAGRTRGLFTGGSNNNIMEYITIQSTGSAIDFGDMNVGRRSGGDGLSNSVRGLIGGGFPATATIDYIQIATTGNAQDFGDLASTNYHNRAVNNANRGVWVGKQSGNTIQFVTISTLGDAQDFGDIITSRIQGAAVSNAHGGL